ncbi:hypothetical protein AVEN_86693-1 [Araneus ventricosus]|uniref:Uncharacterized protein n=1 Tax=Araneus ventricosus TaxID=182803 RepID=A0A4Y2RD75_ARAVE|nr:hypothetical protein AVEN_86693-1 [Araneus ventricosus]
MHTKLYQGRKKGLALWLGGKSYEWLPNRPTSAELPLSVVDRWLTKQPQRPGIAALKKEDVSKGGKRITAIQRDAKTSSSASSPCLTSIHGRQIV